MEAPATHHHSDFLLSIFGTLITFFSLEYNHIMAGLAATFTVILTGMRIVQAYREIKQKPKK